MHPAPGGKSLRRIAAAVLVVAALVGYLLIATDEGLLRSGDHNVLMARLIDDLQDETSDDLASAMILNAWIYTAVGSVRSGQRRIENEQTLRVMAGRCVHRTLLSEEVFAARDIPTRRVGFYGIPMQVGHTSLELFVRGGWRFIDPTFGLYFAAQDQPDLPLSIAEARQRYPDIAIMQTHLPAWRGTRVAVAKIADVYQAGSLYTPIQMDWIPHPEHETLTVGSLVQTYFASTSITLSADDPDVFRQPVHIDLQQQPTGSLGMIDGSPDDLIGPFHRLSYGEFYHPMLYFFGSYEMERGPNNIHAMSFLTPAERTVELTINLVEPADADTRRHLVSQLDHAAARFARLDMTIETRWETEKRLVLTCPVIPPLSTMEYWLTQDFAFRHHRTLIDAIAWSSR